MEHRYKDTVSNRQQIVGFVLEYHFLEQLGKH